MLRRSRRFLALAALVAAPLASNAVAAPTRPAGSVGALSTLEAGVLVDVNQFRREHGLAPLRLSTPLTAASRQHSQSMAARGYFSHDSADGSSFGQRLRRFYSPARYGFWSVGENLLWASPDVDAAHALQLWESSPPHRENLLNPAWREIGISAVHVDAAPGTYGGQPVTIITTDFGVRR
jgi:uncharacterized protein YkwD